MIEKTYTVISTAITQEIPEDFQIASRNPKIAMRPRVRTMLKMEVYVDGEVLGYEAEIPTIMMTRRIATHDEILLAEELNEVDRRHQERLERRGLWR